MGGNVVVIASDSDWKVKLDAAAAEGKTVRQRKGPPVRVTHSQRRWWLTSRHPGERPCALTAASLQACLWHLGQAALAPTRSLGAGPSVLSHAGCDVRCGPCRMIAPFFEQVRALELRELRPPSPRPQLSEKYPSLVFMKVDIDTCQGVAAECGIQGASPLVGSPASAPTPQAAPAAPPLAPLTRLLLRSHANLPGAALPDQPARPVPSLGPGGARLTRAGAGVEGRQEGEGAGGRQQGLAGGDGQGVCLNRLQRTHAPLCASETADTSPALL